MGLIENLRKKFETENATNFIEINIKIDKKMYDDFIKQTTAKRKVKIGRKRKGAKL
jgi:hypothetical protein